MEHLVTLSGRLCLLFFPPVCDHTFLFLYMPCNFWLEAVILGNVATLRWSSTPGIILIWSTPLQTAAAKTVSDSLGYFSEVCPPAPPQVLSLWYCTLGGVALGLPKVAVGWQWYLSGSLSLFLWPHPAVELHWLFCCFQQCPGCINCSTQSSSEIVTPSKRIVSEVCFWYLFWPY